MVVFLFSCEKDNLQENNETPKGNTTSNFTIRELNATEIKSKKYSQQIFSYIENNSNLSQRGGGNIGYYEIETQHAKLMKSPNGEYHSYTHYVMNTPKGEGLENIVYSSNGDQTYTAYLIHYDLSERDINKVALGVPIELKETKVITYTLDQNYDIANLEDGGGCSQLTVQVAYCGEGNHPDGVGTPDDPCTASETYNMYFYVGSGCGNGPSLPGFPTTNPTPGNNTSSDVPNWGDGIGAGGSSNSGEVATTMYISLESLRKKNFKLELNATQKATFNGLNQEMAEAIFSFLEHTESELIILGTDYLSQDILTVVKILNFIQQNLDENGNILPEAEAFAEDYMFFIRSNPNSEILIQNFIFDDTINDNNSDIESFDELKDLLNSEEIILINNDTPPGLETFKIEAGWGGVEVDIEYETNPFTVNNISSTTYGWTLGMGWEQSSTHESVVVNTFTDIATITFKGTLGYSLFWNGLGTVYKSSIIYEIKMDTNTGGIISVIKI